MYRTPHLDAHYEAELQGLSRELMKAAMIARGLVVDATRALQERDRDIAHAVLRRDHDLDLLARDVDASAIRILARRSPVGADLRLVTCTLKAIVDIERIGDLAANIANRSNELTSLRGIEPTEEVHHLGTEALARYDGAIEAFQHRNVLLARHVIAADQVVDDLNRAVFGRMLAIAKDHHDQLEQALALTSISRYLERIADHSVNIAMLAIFLAEGTIVRREDLT